MKFWRERYKEIEAEQIEKLGAIVEQYPSFHAPYTNNYSIILATRQYNNLDSDKRADLFFGLNKADFNLHLLTKSWLDELPRTEENGEILDELLNVQESWNLLIKNGNQFLALKIVETVLKGFELMEFPFQSKLEETKVVKDAFVELISDKMKSMIRISVFMGFGQVHHCLDKILAHIESLPPEEQVVDRIEVAREAFHLEEPHHEKSFPKLHINIDVDSCISLQDPRIIDFQEVLLEILKEDDSKNDLASQRFYYALDDKVAVAQGHRNYKKYLELLGLLDQVYSRETNYALRKEKSLVPG